MRELEGAIGYDCRRLEDGRAAHFRHTALLRRAKRDFFERRDMLMALGASFMAMASMSSHPKADMESAYNGLVEDRRGLLKVAFPYLKQDDAPQADAPQVQEDSYDKYFDELEEIIRKEKEAGKGDGATLAGEDGNDIIDNGI